MDIKYSPLSIPLNVSSNFCRRINPITGKDEDHLGTDFRAPANTPIRAVDSGVVAYKKYNKGGYGNYIVLKHEGYYTLYGHMISPALYDEKEPVSAGDIIGYVGSTGASTGNHLHFEIRVSPSNGDFWNREVTNPVDPLRYISGKTTITNDSLPPVKNPISTEENTDSNIHAESMPYSPASVVGIRSSEYSPQPMHAYVNIYIGDKVLTNSTKKPNIVQSFEFDRITEGGSTGKFSLFDDNWEEIEYYLSNNWDNIYVEYGYANTNIKARYSLIVQGYTVDFNNTGVILAVNCLSEDQIINLNQMSISTGEYNPTKAIIAICKQIASSDIRRKWIIDEKNFDDTVSVNTYSPFDSTNEYPITYILDVIVPQSKTPNGDIVRFYLIDSEVDGEIVTIPYLRSVSYGSPSSGSVRTYVYRKGYDSAVEDLSFDIKGVFGGTSIFHTVTGGSTSFINPYSNSQHDYRENSNTTITETSGEFSHTSAEQSVAVIDSAGSTPEQAKNKLYYYVKNAETSHYEATMTVVGDPSISIMDNIRIINLTDAGNLHHTSGIYMIVGVSDTVSEGSMHTTLALHRVGDINQGVELIDFKKLIK